RIRNAEFGPFLRLGVEREQGVGVRSRGERRVGAEARDVVLVDPRIVVEVGRDVGVLQLRTVCLVESPAFAALAAIHFGRAVEVFALADVEAGKVAAGGERRPNHAIAGDVEAARIDAAFRHLKDLRDAGLGRILAALQADEEAGEGLADAPDIVVYRAGNHAVHAVADQGVELGILGSAGAQRGAAASGRRSAAGVAGIEKIFAAACGNVNVPGLGRIGTARDFAVAVGVENLAAPAARLMLVMRLVVDLGVDPAEDGAGQFVEVDGFIRVVVELDVVGGEAG